ncbi:MAG: DUF1622 domain-containing protein [Bdellovibrionales bacterium]|nr:DUF1622 domain-containing protein [Bdellovibrionales bacterium]
MHENFKSLTEMIALGLEVIAALLIAYGGLVTLFLLVKLSLPKYAKPNARKIAWRDFAAWLLLGLEFTLGADIVRTAIAPTWDSIGQLAAIAVIRTFLGFFLERDFEIASEKEPQ